MSTSLGIAHILPTFGMGGQERVALDLAVGQQARGHRVMAISLGEGTVGPLADEFRAHQLEVASRTKWPRRFGVDASLPPRLALLLRRHRVDVVHTHNGQPLIYGAPAARLAGCAAVHTRHGDIADSRMATVLLRLSGRLTGAYIAVSEDTAQSARRNRLVDDRKLQVIRNGIDLSRFDPERPLRDQVRRELGIPGDAFVVGTVGRVVADKNHALFVSAMEPLCAAGAHAIVVGDGELMPALREQVARSPHAARIHLLGTRRDAPRLLHALDAFCLSSRTEGLPLVILEAMASALPIVSTAVGGIPAVVSDGESGLLVPSEGGAALTTALARLRDDRALGARLGAAGRTLALREYSSDAMVERYLAIYERLRRG